jgi:hypothetical protein
VAALLRPWEGPLRSPSDVNQLHAPVLRGFRLGGIEQLLLAEADGLDPVAVDSERIDQRFADRVGALLAELEIILAVAGAVGA